MYAASCRNPAVNTTDVNVTVLGYREPAIEGNIIFFICPPELELAESRISTCVGTGEWKPDPREIECKGESFSMTLYLHI